MIEGDNSERPTIKPLNIAAVSSPTSDQQNPNSNKADIFTKEVIR